MCPLCTGLAGYGPSPGEELRFSPVANQLLAYRRALIIGQELRLATGSAHWQCTTVDVFGKEPLLLKRLSFPPLGLEGAFEVFYGTKAFCLWMEFCTASSIIAV